MKTKIQKLLSVSIPVATCLGIAPLSVTQAQVIVPKEDVPQARAVEARVSGTSNEERESKKQGTGKSEESKSAKMRKQDSKRNAKATKAKQTPSAEENAKKGKGPETEKTIEEIAKQAARKSVESPSVKLPESIIELPVPTAERLEKKRTKTPRTNPEIAKIAAAEAVMQDKGAEAVSPKAAEKKGKIAIPRAEKLVKPTDDGGVGEAAPLAVEPAPPTPAEEKNMEKVVEAEKLEKPAVQKSFPSEESSVATTAMAKTKQSPDSESVAGSAEEKAVADTSEKVEAEVNKEKLKIETPAQASDMIRRIIGADSELSVSEKRRDDSARRHTSRLATSRATEQRVNVEGSPRDTVVSYLLKRFNGDATVEDAPRRKQENRRGDRLSHDHQHPIYNGRRHVRFQDRQNIPAILLAVSALDRIQVQNHNEVGYLPSPQRFGDVHKGNRERHPADYVDRDSYVVSYDVDPNSMVSRDDVLFLQGSTAFADEYSYEIVRDLAAAIKDPSLANERFVIEGHASAEGSYDYNQRLSQRRAERIVRDMVRQGVSPDRLIPAGYGESEATFSENADERDRRLDRKVVVFRMSQ